MPSLSTILVSETLKRTKAASWKSASHFWCTDFQESEVSLGPLRLAPQPEPVAVSPPVTEIPSGTTFTLKGTFNYSVFDYFK